MACCEAVIALVDQAHVTHRVECVHVLLQSTQLWKSVSQACWQTSTSDKARVPKGRDAQWGAKPIWPAAQSSMPVLGASTL